VFVDDKPFDKDNLSEAPGSGKKRKQNNLF
jgi:hypothetical protein